MAYVTASGTTIAISTTSPASSVDTLTELQALSFTNVNGVITLGTFGDVANLVSFAVLGDGRVRKLAGARDAGTLEFQVAFDALDTGQAAMLAANDDGLEYAFKIVTNDGTTGYTDSEFYFRGLVTSAALNVGSNDSVLSMNFNVTVNSTVFRSLSHTTP